MADSADKVTTVTLVRNKVYSYLNPATGKFHEFKRNVPVEMTDDDEDLVEALEALIEVVTTTDNDEIEKNIFEIDRDAERRTEENKPRRMRLRMVQEDDGRKPQTVLTRNKPVPGRTSGTGLKVGGGRS